MEVLIQNVVHYEKKQLLDGEIIWSHLTNYIQSLSTYESIRILIFFIKNRNIIRFSYIGAEFTP